MPRRHPQEGNLQRVGQRNRLEDGAQFMVAVRPPAKHFQAEIDFLLKSNGKRKSFFAEAYKRSGKYWAQIVEELKKAGAHSLDVLGPRPDK